jgi:predicted negative regulator of RcsB-dependent stress response
MARGWESKDVESQVEASRTHKEAGAQAQKERDQLDRDQQRQGLELSRKRVLADLENATHPNHKKSLEAALAHLDEKITSLK